ncbi:c6 zinc finger domain containing protein [Drepanopeziza brunnea f. sp. 'multigermtubi' MB_m1]|uniref:C6 zinc finger domain containing protein n=1 Tax=Marssonina brunnea f. sp. multigermtubi (strain MB_m1) TaxID=1072389 RepID=K1X6V9_MARBU|nr:c6 zinc finger domain containing protein [Drepanopeziza brunnea f. sp. 'multigermtubi' MB_m1]EKD20821.1 c6 zinc finger domain containing protein [Drepanopeziza brunnea f. sp. 'multigermtubi' MB_m1]
MGDDGKSYTSCSLSAFPSPILWPSPDHGSFTARASTQPSRRRRSSRSNSKSNPSSQSLFRLLAIFSFCFTLSSAAPARFVGEQLLKAQSAVSEPLGSTFERLARSGTILVDRRPAPVPDNNWSPELDQPVADLRPRAAAALAENPTITPTEAPAEPNSGIVADKTPTPDSFPHPFDMGFSNNITTECQTFMDSMLSNSSFRECLPFSMLLSNSNSFFQASKSLVRITQILDYSCAAEFTECSALMSSFASNITTSDSCESDLKLQNPLIQDALLGLKAYKTLYTASCSRNPETSSYCFADSITNVTNPTDSYIYFLPLNTSLVGGSQPTCDSCLQTTMGIFEASSADRDQALANTYVPAAKQVNVNCGPGFVNASLAEPITSPAFALKPPPSAWGRGEQSPSMMRRRGKNRDRKRREEARRRAAGQVERFLGRRGPDQMMDGGGCERKKIRMHDLGLTAQHSIPRTTKRERQRESALATSFKQDPPHVHKNTYFSP